MRLNTLWKRSKKKIYAASLKIIAILNWLCKWKKQFSWHQGSVTSGEHQIANTNGEWKYGLPTSSVHKDNLGTNQQVSSLIQKQEVQVEWEKGLQHQSLWAHSTFTDTLIKQVTSLSLKSDTQRTFICEYTVTENKCLNKFIPFCLEMKRWVV